MRDSVTQGLVTMAPRLGVGLGQRDSVTQGLVSWLLRVVELVCVSTTPPYPIPSFSCFSGCALI